MERWNKREREGETDRGRKGGRGAKKRSERGSEREKRVR